jgi:trimethyllysine dioxygenase
VASGIFQNDMAYEDTAYTNFGIGLHTDGTYSFDPPGLQLLHCIGFDTLTCVKVLGVYIEERVYLRAEHPVVRLHDNDIIKQICFSNFDRAPFQLSVRDETAFYHAHGMCYQLVNDPAMQITIQMRPGNAVWFDNWRIRYDLSGKGTTRRLYDMRSLWKQQ